MGNAFGGLFLYDLLGAQAMKVRFGTPPFHRAAEFADQLPFATVTGKHAAAARYFSSTDASIICVQEGRALFDSPDISSRYQQCQASGDESTMVLFPRGAEAESFSVPVSKALQADLDAKASADLAKAWRTTSSRVAVARMKINDVRVTAASVHCSKHESTADLLLALKKILEREAPAEFFLIGCDASVPGDRTVDFQERMVAGGFDLRCPSDQVIEHFSIGYVEDTSGKHGD